MKKRVISGAFAVLLAVSAVTGISAASDPELSGRRNCRILYSAF